MTLTLQPGAEDEDSTLGPEPLLSTAWAQLSDMLEQTLRPVLVGARGEGRRWRGLE